MPKFRKKPVVVEAEQFWNDRPWPKGVCDCSYTTILGAPHIHTREGDFRVGDSDRIVTGVKKERYPVRDNVFRLTYEAEMKEAEGER